jgi:MFS family permease
MGSGTIGLEGGYRLATGRVIFTVLVPFGCGFYLSYLFRTTNAVISPQLVAEVGLTPADLGFLTAVYFVTFASIQLPLGVVLDRFGPRRVQFVLLLVAALGAAVFAVGQDFAALSLGRGLIGLGVSACLMSALKANALWWPKERLSLVNNLIGAFGSFGALTATAPLEWALQVAGWREIFAGLAAATALLAVVTLLVVPERAGSAASVGGLSDQARAVRTIFASAHFWRFGVLFTVCQAALLSYQTLWAAPWLRDVAGFGRAEVADRLFLLQLGMFAGVLLSGVIADRFRRFGVHPPAVLGTGLGLFLATQLVLALGVHAYAAVTWTAFGFFGAATFLTFAILTERFPPEHTGRVLTAANLLIFVVAFVLQWGIGAIINLFAAAGDGRYPPEAHSTAFFVALGVQVIGFALFLSPLRRTRPAGGAR